MRSQILSFNFRANTCLLLLLTLCYETYSQNNGDSTSYSYESPDTLVNSEFKAYKLNICNYADKLCDDSEVSVLKASNKALTKMLNYFYSQVIGADAKQIYYGESLDIGYAAATSYKKKQYVLYNSKQVKDLKESGKFDNENLNWILFAIIAHEFGHHFNFHLLYSDCPNKTNEQQADDFMGFWLARLGASETQAKLALQNLASENGDEVYDTKQLRIEQLMRGYKRGKLPIKNSPLYFYVKNTLQNKSKKYREILPEMDYATVHAYKLPADTVKFNKNFEELNLDDVDYSTIVSDSIVYFQAKNTSSNKILKLGIITPSIVPYFERMIQDQFYQFWFIDENGYIYSPNKEAQSGFTLIGKL